MNLNEFRTLRKPFYIHPETLLIKFPRQKHLDSSCAEWFSDENIPFLHTIRGYYNEEDNYVMLYTNDFETPDISIKFLTYIFEYFPNIDWIGIGCIKGKEGEIWSPKMKIQRTNVNKK